MISKIFGTDGVRGLANQFPMNPETALALGRALASVFLGKRGHRRIVIGKDTRLSGYMIENALSAGICSMGGEAIFLGPLPTPGIAFITHAMRADAGVVISASHNPYYDNGIKFFDHQGYKLPDDIERLIEATLFTQPSLPIPTHAGVGKAYRVDDAVGRYIEYLKVTFPKSLSLEGMKIAVDCAHGAAYRVAPVVFEELGAEVFAIGVEPNGTNINEYCGALYPQALQQKVLEVKADLGVALDGDADRLVVVDEAGEILHGDILLALCARDWQERKLLSQDTLVTTVMSNMGLEVQLNAWGIRLCRVQVGDRYLIEAMRQHGYNLGGEQSGHMIFLEHSTTGDGILAALQVMSMLKRRDTSLGRLSKGIVLFPQVLRNVRVSAKKELSMLPGLVRLRREIEEALGKKGRLLLRYSGTEPLLRIMLEGENFDQIDDFARRLQEEAEISLGRG